MGCDIHCYAEEKSTIKGIEKWRFASHLKMNHYYDPENPEGEKKYELVDIYDGRNYSLFAILAGVRNGSGFAGCDTGDPVKPISEPKGLPSDVSDILKKESDSWDSDGHSHSYFTLKELKDFDWSQKIRHRGFVNPEEYKSFMENGKPSGWCGGVSGTKVIHIPPQEMQQRIKKNHFPPGDSFYCQIEWEETFGEATSFDDCIKKLESLAWWNEDRYDKVRIVFWFDN